MAKENAAPRVVGTSQSAGRSQVAQSVEKKEPFIWKFFFMGGWMLIVVALGVAAIAILEMLE